MSTAYGHLISEFNAKEEGGAIVSMRRKYIVQDLTSTTSAAIQEALNCPDIPQAGTQATNYPGLMVVRREAEIDPNDNKRCYVIVDYERIQRAVFSREDFQFRVTGGTELAGRRTAFDSYGNQLYVQHTFPSDDEDWPNELKTQGAEVDVLVPQSTLKFDGILRTSYPHYISAAWVWHLNLYPWAGALPSAWLCTAANYELHQPANPNVVNTLDFSMPQWRFSFEFLFDQEGQQPAYRFMDRRWDTPPPNLVAGVGIKTAEIYPYRDFNELFPV